MVTKRLSPTLLLALVGSFAWVILAAGAIGATTVVHRAAFGWAVLAFVVATAIAQPFRRAGYLAAVVGAAAFAGVLALQTRLDHYALTAHNLDVKAMIA